MSRTDGERYCLIALSLVPGIGPVRLRRLLDGCGSAEAAWQAPPPALRALGLEDRVVAALVAQRRQRGPAEVAAWLASQRTRALLPDDDDYPARLRELAGGPLILYLRGDLRPADDRAVALVGTRRASTYGREMARRLASDLTAAGLTVVSGLARGIDAAAHSASLAAGGRTLAVLGSGPDIIYPAEHRRLAERIIEQGALLAEHPPGTPPDAPNFPARNRLIAGLALAVVVVEAAARSGALITAGFAADQGRDVGAVPGPIVGGLSDGCHALIRDGATLITSAADILELLAIEAPTPTPLARPLPLAETPVEQQLLDLLVAGPALGDELSRASGLPMALVNTALMMLELKGLIRQSATLGYERA